MEADSLSGGIARLIFKFGFRWVCVCGQTVCPGQFLARQNALVFMELEAACSLGLF